MTAAPKPPRWRPRGLRRQLVLGVSAVVTAVFVAVGAVSVLSLRTYVTATIDADLYESLNAFSHYFADYRHVDNVVKPDGQSNIGAAMLGFSDQTPGNVLAVLRDGVVIGAVVFTKRDPYRAPADVVATIAGGTGPVVHRRRWSWAAWATIGWPPARSMMTTCCSSADRCTWRTVPSIAEWPLPQRFTHWHCWSPRG